jgi:hypothetical protein
MKSVVLALPLGIFCSVAVSAAVITEPTRFFAVGYDLADLEFVPVTFLQSITDSAIVSLTEVRVGLHLVGRDGGGFAGEMYVQLNRDLSLTSVLLNQVGVDGANPFGAPYDGWNVLFADNAAGGDVHVASLVSGVLTGDFAPDGRYGPTDVARPALLNVFQGVSGNGDWRLSVADLELGGTMRLESWSLTLSGSTDIDAVPEASSWAVGFGLLGLAGFGGWQRWRLLRRRQL